LVQNWVRFWLRRFVRLAPAYYLSLGLAVVLGPWFLGGYREWQSLNPLTWTGTTVYDPARIDYSVTNILLHLSFLFGLHPTYSFSTFLPDWSLSLEMQFYAVFPCLFLALRRGGFITVPLLIGMLSYGSGSLVRSHVTFFEPSLLLFKLQCFLAGVLLARMLLGDESSRRRVVMFSSGIFLLLLDRSYGAQTVVLPIVFAAMVGLGTLELKGRVPVWMAVTMNGSWVRFASETSYGVYLFHGFFISLCGWLFSRSTVFRTVVGWPRLAIVFCIVAAGAYTTAYGSYRFVEKPAMRWGKTFLDWCMPRRTSSSA